MGKDNKTLFKGAIVLLAIGYAISPIDILPDIVPFIGTLDDASIAAIAGYLLKD